MNIKLVEEQVDIYRAKYGSGTYISIFDDGLIVPWRPLTVEECFKYTNFAGDGYHLENILEDEIFLKCVLDDTIIRQFSFLKAGSVSEVVKNILVVSNPFQYEDIKFQLDSARSNIKSNNPILHEFVKYITMAFPYTPTELYKMQFNQLLKIFVLAEQKLLAMGMIQEEFQLANLNQESESIPEEKPKVDAKKLWESIHGVNAPDENVELDQTIIDQQFRMPKHLEHPFNPGEKEELLNRAQNVQKRHSWRDELENIRKVENRPTPKQFVPDPDIDMNDPNISPIIKYPGRHKIDFKVEEMTQTMSLMGHERQDIDINRELMVKEAQKLYAPVLEYLDKHRGKYRGNK